MPISQELLDKIKNRELHRITTTTLVYVADSASFKYLITRRSLHKVSHPGMWTIPGGGLSIDDYISTPNSEHGPNLWYGALETALRREIKEEVNVEIGKPELIIDMAFIRPDGTPVICFSYFAPFVSGEVRVDQDENGDTIDFAWVSLEEAKKYDLIGGIWDEIRQAEEILKARK